MLNLLVLRTTCYPTARRMPGWVYNIANLASGRMLNLLMSYGRRAPLRHVGCRGGSSFSIQPAARLWKLNMVFLDNPNLFPNRICLLHFKTGTTFGRNSEVGWVGSKNLSISPTILESHPWHFSGRALSPIQSGGAALVVNHVTIHILYQRLTDWLTSCWVIWIGEGVLIWKTKNCRRGRKCWKFPAPFSSQKSGFLLFIKDYFS